MIVSEWTPILEARRAADALSKLGIEVNGVVVNNLLYPEALTHAFFKERRKMQDEYSSLIKEQFAGKVIVEVPLLERDIKGITMLRRVANYMFGGDPTEALPSIRNTKTGL